MNRLVLPIAVVLFMGGCQIGSISEVGRFVVRDDVGAIVSSRRPPFVSVADVRVELANIEHNDEMMYCPVAAITVDDQCDEFDASKKLDRVCRWTETSGKDSALQAVRWETVTDHGQPQRQFEIVFEGDVPCNAGPLKGVFVVCNAKTGGLGLEPGEEMETPYDIEVDDCPILDPYIIWRQ
ncbi:MAG: hypothetical protein P8Y95_03230 [Gammaproteobacteria bacterium]